MRILRGSPTCSVLLNSVQVISGEVNGRDDVVVDMGDDDVVDMGGDGVVDMGGDVVVDMGGDVVVDMGDELRYRVNTTALSVSLRG